MTIEELDLSVDGAEIAKERAEEIFTGILEVITELENELESLENEKIELETNGNYTASGLKRRAVIGNEIVAAKEGLTKAKEEYKRITEENTKELSNLVTNLRMQHDRKLRSVTKDLKNEALTKLKEAENIVKQVNQILDKGKDNFNREVITPTNKATGLNGHNRILDLSYYLSSLTLKKLEVEKRQGWF